MISYPFGKILSDVVGKAFGGVALSYAFSVPGLVMWLLIIIALSLIAISAVAVLFLREPARNHVAAATGAAPADPPQPK